MTIAWSELNPTGELREWHWVDIGRFGRTVAEGYAYNDAYAADGTRVRIKGIKEIRDYKDHLILVTYAKQFYRAEKKDMDLRGI